MRKFNPKPVPLVIFSGKVEAVIYFLQSTGRRAYITNLDLLDETLADRTGTVFQQD